MKKIFSIFILLLFIPYSYAQEMLGLINSNYSGIYGIASNPANMSGSKLYLDFNLLSVQTFFDNNYIYWDKDDLMTFLKTRETPVYYTEENEERSYSIFRDNESKNGFQDIKIIGPSAMVAYGEHAFAVTTGLRSMTSFKNLPADMAVFLYEAIDYQNLHNINFLHEKRIATSSLAWAEVGFSYSYNFYRYKWDSWSAGITIKPLIGLDAAYISIDNVDYKVHYDDSASVYNVAFEYGYSLPIDYVEGGYNSSPLFKGFGISADIGVTFSSMANGHSNILFTKLCEQQYEDYNYKIGFSILDLGYIKFNKNTAFYSYQDASTEWYRPYDTIKTNNLSEMSEKIASFFIDEENDGDSQDYMVLYLPTTASLQADVHLDRAWYLGANFYQPIPISKRSIFRPSLISIAPRYETARLEASMPVSMYNYDFSNIRLGFMFRYGNFFFGFDKLNIYLTNQKVTGIDFYAGLRLNLSNTLRMNYIKGKCDRKKLRNIETFDFRNF